jgi:hypothetical protein
MLTLHIGALPDRQSDGKNAALTVFALHVNTSFGERNDSFHDIQTYSVTHFRVRRIALIEFFENS